MRETEYTSIFDALVFQIPVYTGVQIDLRFTFLSRRGASLVVIAPDEFAGSTIGLPNVPSFGMPWIFGYHYSGRLTSKCRTWNDGSNQKSVRITVLKSSRRSSTRSALTSGDTFRGGE